MEVYASKTVAELRSLLTANGVAVPQTYLKKAELVEMCSAHLHGRKDSPISPPSRTVSGSRSRKSSATVRRQSSRHSRIVDSDSDTLPDPLRKRTPSPDHVVGRKSFSGHQSLSSPAIGRKKISVTPMATMPPRPKSFTSRDSDSIPHASTMKSRVVILIFALVTAMGATYLFTTSAPRVPLCNTNGSPHRANTTCIPCPQLGTCLGGALKSCSEHFVVHGDQCVRDEAKFVNAMAIIDSMVDFLSYLRGRKDCGEIEVVDSLTKEQIRVSLRAEFRSLSDTAYTSAFDLAFNGTKKEGLSIPPYIVTTPLGLFRSQFPNKSVTCKVKQFFRKWIWTIIISLASAVYVLVKVLKWKGKRDLTTGLLRAIENNTHYHDGRVQGLSVLDLRDTGMPLHGMEDKEARKVLNGLVKTHPDIQSGEEIHRAGETVYWSTFRLRAEQSVNSRSQSPVPMVN